VPRVDARRRLASTPLPRNRPFLNPSPCSIEHRLQRLRGALEDKTEVATGRFGGGSPQRERPRPPTAPSGENGNPGAGWRGDRVMGGAMEAEHVCGVSLIVSPSPR